MFARLMGQEWGMTCANAGTYSNNITVLDVTSLCCHVAC